MNQTGWNLPISQFIQVKILFLKMVAGWKPFFFKSTSFTSSTFPIHLDFSQNQPAAITLNIGSPRTLPSIEWEELATKGHFSNEPRAVTMKLWEPKRKCPKAIPTHLQNHVVRSRILKCSVKSHVIEPSINGYFNEFLFMRVLTHDNIE